MNLFRRLSNPIRAQNAHHGRGGELVPDTAGGRQIAETNGWILLSELRDTNGRLGRWYEASTDKEEHVLLMRQGPNQWHAFGKAMWTGSGRTPAKALSGGLGDVVDSDASMKSYCRMVLGGPVNEEGGDARLGCGVAFYRNEYHGLHAAQSQCYSEFGT